MARRGRERRTSVRRLVTKSLPPVRIFTGRQIHGWSHANCFMPRRDLKPRAMFLFEGVGPNAHSQLGLLALAIPAGIFLEYVLFTLKKQDTIMKNKTVVILLALCFPIALQAQLVPAAKGAANAQKALRGAAVSAQTAEELAASTFKTAQIKYDNALDVYNRNPILVNQKILESAEKELSAAKNRLDKLSYPKIQKNENLPLPKKIAREVQSQTAASRILLMDAGEKGDLDAIKQLLAQGKVTPMEALKVSLAHRNIVEYLLDTYYSKKFPLSEEKVNFTMQLHRELKNLVDAMIKNGYAATLERFIPFLDTSSPLNEAAPNKLKELIQLPEKIAQEVQDQTAASRILLMDAGEKGDLDAIKRLLAQGKVTPMEALKVSLAHRKIVEYLLVIYYSKRFPLSEEKVNFTVQLHRELKNLVDATIKNGYAATLERFIPLLDITPNKLKELIQLARLYQQPEIEGVLIDLAKDKMLGALFVDHLELADAYLSSGVVNINDPELLGFVYNHTTSSRLLFLIDHGLNPNIRLGKDSFNGTMLHLAVKDAHRNTFNILMDHGGDLTIADDLGNTPIFYAIEEQGEMLDEILEQITKHPDYLSVLRQKNAAGRTPIEEAKHLKHKYAWNGNFSLSGKYKEIANRLKTFEKSIYISANI